MGSIIAGRHKWIHVVDRVFSCEKCGLMKISCVNHRGGYYAVYIDPKNNTKYKRLAGDCIPLYDSSRKTL